MSLLEATPHLHRSPSIRWAPSIVPRLVLPCGDDEEQGVDNVTYQNNGKIIKIPFLLIPRSDSELFNELKNKNSQSIQKKEKENTNNTSNDNSKKILHSSASTTIPSLTVPTAIVEIVPSKVPIIPGNVPTVPKNVPTIPKNVPIIPMAPDGSILTTLRQNKPKKSSPKNVLQTTPIKNIPQIPQNVPHTSPENIPQRTASIHKEETSIEFYTGMKNFWRTGTVVDFKLIDHREYGVIEVIMKITAKAVEAPRFYFSSSLLYSKFSGEMIEEKMRLKRQMLLDLPMSDSVVMGEEDLRESVLRDMAVEYIETRLHVPSEGNFEFQFRPLPHDSLSGGQLDVITVKPEGLVRYKCKPAIMDNRARDWAASLRRIDNAWCKMHFPEGLKKSVMLTDAILNNMRGECGGGGGGGGGKGGRNNSRCGGNTRRKSVMAISYGVKKRWQYVLRRFSIICGIAMMKYRLENIYLKSICRESSEKEHLKEHNNSHYNSHNNSHCNSRINTHRSHNNTHRNTHRSPTDNNEKHTHSLNSTFRPHTDENSHTNNTHTHQNEVKSLNSTMHTPMQISNQNNFKARLLRRKSKEDSELISKQDSKLDVKQDSKKEGKLEVKYEGKHDSQLITDFLSKDRSDTQLLLEGGKGDNKGDTKSDTKGDKGDNKVENKEDSKSRTGSLNKGNSNSNNISSKRNSIGKIDMTNCHINNNNGNNDNNNDNNNNGSTINNDKNNGNVLLLSQKEKIEKTEN